MKLLKNYSAGPKPVPNHFATPPECLESIFELIHAFEPLFGSRLPDVQKSLQHTLLRSGIFMSCSRMCLGNPENELFDAAMIVEASLYIV